MSTFNPLVLLGNLALGATLALGSSGCAMDAQGESFPQENAGIVTQHGEYAVEKPVIQVPREGEPEVVYRAILFSEEVALETTKVLDELRITLDIDIPELELRDAAKNQRFVIIPLSAADPAPPEWPDDGSLPDGYYRCSIELDNGMIADGICVGEPVQHVTLKSLDLQAHGFDVGEAAELEIPYYRRPGPGDPNQ